MAAAYHRGVKSSAIIRCHRIKCSVKEQNCKERVILAYPSEKKWHFQATILCSKDFFFLFGGRHSRSGRIRTKEAGFLTVIGEVFEQLLSKQLPSLIDPMLNNNLTAYRKDQNCETSFIGSVERWKQAVDKRIVVGVLSTDMSKAFYSLYPPLLINKLRAYGFSNNVLTLMGSYFTNKKQSLDQSRNNKRWVRDHERLSPGIGLRVPSLERLSKRPTPLHRMKIGYSCTRMTTNCFQWRRQPTRRKAF